MPLSLARCIFGFSLLGGGLAGCSSDALGGGSGGATNAGAGGQSEGGTRTQGGASSQAKGGGAGNPSNLPDYASSACYGQVGETLIYDIQTHVPEPFQATCRGETERVRLYVADELFGTKISQQQVNGFLHRYELVGHEGSAHPDLGVLSTDEAVFGEIDSALLASDKLPIFVVDTKRAGAGYLCSWCDGLELHLDGVQLVPFDGDTALSIAAHETYHVIHKGFDANEEPWVDESLAQAAMSVNGFFSDRALLNGFAQRPNVNWGPAAELHEFDYGAGLAFGTYLWEFGGEKLMRAATSTAANGWAGLDAALRATGHEETAFELFLRMAVALYLDDPERAHGFRSFDLVKGVSVSSATSGTVQPYGLVYYAPAEGTAALRVEGPASLRALVFSDDDPVELTQVELGADTEIAESSVLIVTAESTAPISYSISEL